MRFVLNSDIIFFSNLFTAISRSNLDEWNKSIHSYNCFDLPTEDHIPVTLQYSASVNVLLAELTLADKIEDSRNRRVWGLANNVVKREFDEARNRLRKLGLDVELLSQTTLLQANIETDPSIIGNEVISLYDYARPTATATEAIARQGSILADRTDLSQTLCDLGRHFGNLIYWLDALEDFDSDRKRGHFNAIAAAYNLGASPLPETTQRDMSRLIEDTKDEILSLIRSLDIDYAALANQFDNSVRYALNGELPNAVGKLPLTFSEKLTYARAQALEALERRLAQCATRFRPIERTVALPILFVTFLILPTESVHAQQLAQSGGNEDCWVIGCVLLCVCGVITAIRQWYAENCTSRTVRVRKKGPLDC